MKFLTASSNPRNGAHVPARTHSTRLAFTQRWTNKSTITQNKTMPTKSREYFSSLPPISTASSTTPARTTSDPKRRAPFKPPRPSAADGEAVTSKAKPATIAGNGVRKRASAKRKSSETAGKSKRVKGKAKAKADTPIIISDADEDEDEEESEAEQRQSRRDKDKIPTDEDEEQSDPIDEFSEIEEEDSTLASAPRKARSTTSTAKRKNSMLDDGLPPIPTKLLTRLLYEGFEDKDMKIGKEAMTMFGKYVETFVREGLARAIAERQEEGSGLGGGGVSDGFVQVEDLEKVAAQLLLDF